VKKLIFTIITAYFLFSSFTVRSGEFRVIFINPGHEQQNETGNFWLNVNRFMQAAADDLDLDLTTYFANRNHLLMKKLVNQAIAVNPDYVILVNEKGVAIDMITALHNADIPIFMLLNDLSQSQRSELTLKQRGSIIGSVVPDNYKAGQKLAFSLIEHHKLTGVNADSKIKILALQGDYVTPAALERQAGFNTTLESLPNVELIKNSVANWSRVEGYSKTLALLKRFPVDIIWAANDPMAFGAKQAALEEHPDRGITIGGINWDVNDPQFPLDVSFGGHVTLGAKALLMLQAHFKETNRADDMYKTVDVFRAGDAERIIKFNHLMSKSNLDNIDFNRFSDSAPDTLEFTVENLLRLSNN